MLNMFVQMRWCVRYYFLVFLHNNDAFELFFFSVIASHTSLLIPGHFRVRFLHLSGHGSLGQFNLVSQKILFRLTSHRKDINRFLTGQNKNKRGK